MDATHDAADMVLDNAMARLGRRRSDRREIYIVVTIAAALCFISGCAAMKALIGGGAGLGQDILDSGGTGIPVLDMLLQIAVPIGTAVAGGYVAARRQRKKRIEPAMSQIRELAVLIGALLANDNDAVSDEGQPGDDSPIATPSAAASSPDTQNGSPAIAKKTQVLSKLQVIAQSLGQTL